MKIKMKLFLIVSVVLIIMGTIFVVTLNAASTTHEAEASTNNLKYASVVGDYVEFKETKDAYIEMKNVNSLADGELTLTFVYSATNQFPLELKVNGTTIASKDTISSTGGSWNEISYVASMNSGTNNKIKFKIRDAVSGIKLDKVIISTDEDSSVTSTPVTTTSVTTTESPQSVEPTSTQDLSGNVYYVSSSGNSGNSGSNFDNALDIETAISNAKSGETLMLKGGTYKISYSSGNKNTINLSKSGTSSNPIKIETYNNERAIIDFQFPENTWVQDSYGFYLTGDYWSIKNIDITHAGYQGVYVTGAHNTFENCHFYDNRNTGIEINKGGSYTTLINCDAFKNYDPKKSGSMADGFGPKQTMGAGNKLIGCRAWNNSDDGFDCYDSPEKVIFQECWAFNNGVDIWNQGGFSGNGNGFKVGGNYEEANHVLTNCIAFGQPKKGFDQNNNTGGLTIYNCLAYDNGTNFGLGNDLNSDQQHILKNNISLSASNTISNATQSNNTWNSGFSVSSSDFLSLDTSLATIDRNLDGSIPETNLFRLKSSSSLIDSGVNVGLDYNGSNPDIGAFETNY